MIKFKRSKKNVDNFSISYMVDQIKTNPNKDNIMAVLYEIILQANQSGMRVQFILKGGKATYYFYNINNCTIDEWTKEMIDRLNNDLYLDVG